MTCTPNEEPHGLSPDAEPIADCRATGNMQDDAKTGSARLLAALLGLAPPPRKPRRIRVAPAHYGSTEDRRIVRGQIERLQRAVADHFGLPVETMKGWRGPKPIIGKRQIAMYLAREVIQASYPDIGHCFGGKDHTTVMHACEVVQANRLFAADVAALREKVRA